MATRYIKEIQSVQPEGPYFLGGYCMGGTIALEMGRQLCERGHEVGLLAFFETYHWARRPPRPKWGKVYAYGQKIEFHLRNSLLLDRVGQRQFLYEKAKVLRSRTGVWYGMALSKLGRRAEQRGAQHALVARVWEANERAPFHYVPGVYPGRITSFLPIKEYSANKAPGMDWRDVASGGVETHVLPVYPAGMMVEPFVRRLATELRDCIDRVCKGEQQ
jgi:hypothetical protein